MINLRNEEIVSADLLAALWNLSYRRVVKLVELGHIPEAEAPGKYKLWASTTAYIMFLQDRIGGRKSSADSTAERARLTAAQAEKTELEVAEIKGGLVRAAAIHKQDAMLANTLKNNLLSMPDRIAALCAAEADPVAVHDIITGEVVHSLQAVVEALSGMQVDDATLDITRRTAHEYLDQDADLLAPADESTEYQGDETGILD